MDSSGIHIWKSYGLLLNMRLVIDKSICPDIGGGLCVKLKNYRVSGRMLMR